jgi:hypothetical protein
MHAPSGVGRSSSVVWRLATQWWQLFFATLLIVASPVTRAETTLTTTWTSATCTVFTPGAPGSTRVVPCDASGLSVNLAAGEVLQAFVTFQYLYTDDGLSFASGAGAVLCNGAPCDRYPGVLGPEFGELSVGVRSVGCCERSYPVSLPLTNGPDTISGSTSFVEYSAYGTLTPSSVEWAFFADTVTVSATPEPATWLLMVLALPLMVVSLRRRSDEG